MSPFLPKKIQPYSLKIYEQQGKNVHTNFSLHQKNTGVACGHYSIFFEDFQLVYL